MFFACKLALLCHTGQLQAIIINTRKCFISALVLTIKKKLVLKFNPIHFIILLTFKTISDKTFLLL